MFGAPAVGNLYVRSMYTVQPYHPYTATLPYEITILFTGGAIENNIGQNELFRKLKRLTTPDRFLFGD
jgi:hypothetical protein